MANEIKAWTFTHGGYPNALHRTTIPKDRAPLKTSEILIRVKAASINPVDIQLMGYPLMKYIPNLLLRSQKGVGEDFAGIVEESGPDSGYERGDEVLGIGPFLPSGTLQEIIKLDTRSTQALVVRKPADWSWEQAGALPLVWLTARTLVEGVASQVTNKKVAVLGGSSSCGMYAVHLARQRGWEVIATCSGRNTEFVKSMGAKETIDYTLGGVQQRLKSFAPDAIIDCVGGTDCIGLCKRYVTVVGDKTNRMSMGGAFIYLGNPRMVLRTVLGWTGLMPSYACFNLSLRSSYLRELSCLPKDKIIVDSTYDFDHVKEAFERLNTGRTRGKVVIIF
ncbi:NAD(P)-binding protein [Xylariaceae sp. FL1019]|nr:NAD(P)-binding protein [Xylariaceae sp. FL1019]